ncbi:MAG: amidohydrolase [Candidatus Latescibacteria bacterium]|nr:amidohydrolase [Candidatus Latescibacterota bacterium]
MSIRTVFILCLSIILLFPGTALTAGRMDTCKKEATEWIDANHRMFDDAARAIHEFAETALREHQSAEYLANMLERDGFTVERGVAGMPIAFVATFGSSGPVIGILAEYDALPALSQKPGLPSKEAVEQGAPGHGCGHNLYGAGSAAAAMAIKAVMEKRSIPGTIKLFGCPAEETVVGKVYMAKEGVFDGVDACFAWHPGSKNRISLAHSRALNNFEVTFRGKTAHGSADPWNGRSALDAVELMNIGVNYMREHLKDPVRIHYVIPDGGAAPNIVPDYARVWYFVRDIDRKGVEETYAKVLRCAEGAALMTETTMEVNLITGVYDYLPNHTLSEVLYRNLQAIGTPEFAGEEERFAKEMQNYLGIEEKGMNTDIEPFEEPKTISGGSTDIADVSWIVPTAGELAVVTMPAGIPGHSWAVTSASCSSTGLKGMHVAAKVLATGGIEVLMDKKVINKARGEFEEKTEGFTYKSAVPAGQKPQLPQN